MPYISLNGFGHFHGVQFLTISMLLWNVILDMNNLHSPDHDWSCYCSRGCLFKENIYFFGWTNVGPNITQCIFLHLRFRCKFLAKYHDSSLEMLSTVYLFPHSLGGKLEGNNFYLWSYDNNHVMILLWSSTLE